MHNIVVIYAKGPGPIITFKFCTKILRITVQIQMFSAGQSTNPHWIHSRSQQQTRTGLHVPAFCLAGYVHHSRKHVFNETGRGSDTREFIKQVVCGHGDLLNKHSQILQHLGGASIVWIFNDFQLKRPV